MVNILNLGFRYYEFKSHWSYNNEIYSIYYIWNIIETIMVYQLEGTKILTPILIFLFINYVNNIIKKI